MIADSVGQDQTAQSDLDLHCLQHQVNSVPL